MVGLGPIVVVVVLEVVVGAIVVVVVVEVVVGAIVVVVVVDVVVAATVVVVVGAWQLSTVTTAVTVSFGAGPNVTVDPTAVPSLVPRSWFFLSYHSTVPPPAVYPDGHAIEKLCPGLTGLGGLGGPAPADGRTNPTVTAVATTAKTMTRRRIQAPSLGCIVTALTSSA
jgi:hypothetical protein